ncbi:aminomethyl transferase family protein [Proteus mirabilis]|uniref:aminomethyl transferase family protein n=1 Tax=Proteus mirabilis TaxID=584 RepID=UPI001C2C7004|nr:aminomethyl transferase family protein [Proteus mirabilis]MBU9979497.1 aminomethyl transferase family protein [Proteus mirabilis]
MKYFEMENKANVLFGEYNGVTLPKRYANEHEAYFSVRNSILMTDFSHYGMVKISGEDAWRLLNYLISADISSIRDEQLLYTLLLDKEGKIISDAYVLCDNEHYFLISEWMNSDAICQQIKKVLDEQDERAEHYQIDAITSLTPDWRMICLEGPYAWEILSEIVGMDIIGLPFHEFMYVDEDVITMRVGKHGEYCYHIMGDEEKLMSIWRHLCTLSEKFDLKIGGVDDLKNIRLENPCWEPQVINPFSRCPIELQMQWAISYDKDAFIGQNAIKQRADNGVEQKIVGARIINMPQNAAILQGDAIYYQNEQIGVVIQVGYSFILKEHIARILLKREFAYVDIDDYKIKTAYGDIDFITTSIPFVNNLSLIINPTEDSYLERHQ